MRANALPLLSCLAAILATRALLTGRVPVPLDRPNERSLHAAPIPRGGGLAIWLGWACAWPWLPVDAAWLAPVLIVALVSLLDDVQSVSVRWRLLTHAAVSALFVLLAFPAQPWYVVTAQVLGLMWSLNLFNFMDGADGLAGGAAVIGFATYALAATLAGVPEFGLLNATLAAACLGFLWFNFHPARIFLGDVGAVPLGFLAGAFGLWGIRLGCWTASFALLVFLPFIVDATFTVLRRSASGERIWQAHREHCYQRLIRLGWSHRATALAYYALMTGCAGSALALLQLRPGFMWGMLALWLGAHAALYLLLDRYWIRHGRQRDNN